jgi:GT2 family glycosyltransferase
MKRKIGLGLVTCNREDFVKKQLDAIPFDKIDEFVIVNDGNPFKLTTKHPVLQHDRNMQVGESKNDIYKYLLDKGCDYIFSMEDDVLIKDPNIFDTYINACNATGIQHFNFGFSQRENLDQNFKPVFKKIIDYGSTKIVLTQNILGAFTFYTRRALQTVGLHYYEFNKGHGDHLELTYRAWKYGLGTPFWWFADVYESWNMLENLSNLTTDSIVRRPETFMTNFNEARSIFKKLHGIDIFEIPQLPEAEVVNCLRRLKNDFSSSKK